jgi:hypothetical protein
MTWAAVLGFLKKIPDWVWWLFLIIAAATFIDMKARSEERKKVNAKRDKESAEVESQVISQITENSNAMVRESDAVRSHTSAERLPDGTATLPEYNYRD